MSVLRLAARSTARVLTQPWVLAVVLLMVLIAWSNTGTESVPAPQGDPLLLRPSAWDTLQVLFTDSWGLIYVAATPCAFLGVALTGGARQSGWSALTAHRVGGVRQYTTANLIAGLLVTITLVAVFALVTVVVGAVRGASFIGPAASKLAALAVDFAPERSYTVLPALGVVGSLALLAAAFSVVSLCALLLGQWIGTICRRTIVASAISAAIVILTSRIGAPQLPFDLRARVDLWQRNNLDYYVVLNDDGSARMGELSLAWVFVTPVVLIAILATATWWETRRRGVASSSV